MLKIYPFGSGSFYTASHAVTASVAISGSFITYVTSASYAGSLLNPVSGPRGKSVCLLTYDQYLSLSTDPTYVEYCNFS